MILNITPTAKQFILEQGKTIAVKIEQKMSFG